MARPQTSSRRQRPAPKLSRAGQAGRERLAKELDRQAKRKAEAQAAGNVPFRYFVKKGNKGEIIICDDEPTFWRYEHNYKGDDGYRNQHCACLQETEICPACKALPDSKAYYAMFLTVIDCVGYTTKDGDEVPFTKKLICIKSQQQDKWLRRIDAHIEQHGTLRGACFDLHRSQSDTSPATGDDLDDVGHEDLDTEESENLYLREYTDREGKKHEDDLREVVDYEDVFDTPTVEELEEKFGVAPPAGSDRANNAEKSQPSGRERGKAARRSASQEKEYDSTSRDNVDWEQDKKERPTTNRSRPSASDSAKRSRPTRAGAQEKQAPTRRRRTK